MNRHFSFTLIFLAQMVLLSCCSKEKSSCGYTETTHISYNVDAGAKSKIPYAGNDTLIFKSNNDTAKLYGTGRTTSDEPYVPVGTNSDCGGGPQYTYHHENIWVGYSGLSLLLRNIRYRAYRSEHYQGNIPQTNDMMFFANSSSIEKTTFEYIDSRINTPEDSIYLNGTYEKGVFFDDLTRKVLFSYSKGVLRFTSLDGRLWTRIK